jgi:hypothetical protein
VDGLDILTRTLSTEAMMGPKGRQRLLQYHPRSDRHSKVACWAIVFDLLQESSVMRQHATDGKIGFGINHKIVDFVNGKDKDLDLVICRPGDPADRKKRRPYSLVSLRQKYDIDLTRAQEHALSALPALPETSVGSVLVACEAKAAMTAHQKAQPRLYDELNSSHQIVHAASSQALAVGFAMVNASASFISPDRRDANGAPVVNQHDQPRDAQLSIDTVKRLHRRAGPTGAGYDGLGITVVDLANDGSPVRLVQGLPAPPAGDPFHYESMIRRVTHEYETRFGGL